MEVCLMIEGQEDVTSVDDRRERGALDAWTTIAALAAVTTRLRLGTLVSPATFRHPAVLAKSVVTADHVSGGRVELGLGAGWWEREHEAFGIPLPPVAPAADPRRPRRPAQSPPRRPLRGRVQHGDAAGERDRRHAATARSDLRSRGPGPGEPAAAWRICARARSPAPSPRHSSS